MWVNDKTQQAEIEALAALLDEQIDMQDTLKTTGKLGTPYNSLNITKTPQDRSLTIWR